MTNEQFKQIINYLVKNKDLIFKGPLFISNNENKVLDEGDKNKDITPAKEVLDATLLLVSDDNDLEAIYEKRREEYGLVQDQLDLIYWDKVDGTTKWKDHIAKVKLGNPKP